VIVQAGASDAGRQLAAETAEAVFTAQSDLKAGQSFYADVKGRMEKVGRDPDHMKILPGCMVYVGDSLDEARAKRAKLDSLVHYDSAIASLSIALGHDASLFDPAKMHVLGHKGKYLSVRGPLNIARPIQGWPVIVQAGASESGRQLAAETAEAVFTAQSDLAAGQKFYADVKTRMEKLGRSREHMKILPACFVVVGDTLEEARAKRAKLDSLVDYANAIASLSIALGHDASKFDPDGPLPDNIPESNASKSGRERAIALARRDNLTVRQLAQRLGGYSGLAMIGTAKTIADEMEEWLETEGSDGFTVMFPYLPGGLDDFVTLVVPELQRRGLFRREYEGVTLREHLGLPRPNNRFFQN
jgi:alkanesulfonate monooxygenase